MSNILKRADEIVNERSEEQERQYGPFQECMENMRDIFNAMTGHCLNTRDMYIAMVALKFARERYAYKEDNLLDAVAYIGALNNYEGNRRPSTPAGFSDEDMSEFKKKVAKVSYPKG